MVVLLLMFISYALSCSDGPPDTFFTDFNINGPCPASDNALAPVGTTVQYRCAYVDKRSSHSYSDIAVPVWRIPLLSSKLLIGTSSELDLTVTSFIIQSGGSSRIINSLLNILVKEEYLKNALDIQCGICTGLSACAAAVVAGNVATISFSAKLVAFGLPRNLQHASTDQNAVYLSWSPPIVPSGYSGSFIYEVVLNFTTDSSPNSVVFLRNESMLNVSELYIPDSYDIVCEYSPWSVTAIVSGTNIRSSTAIQNNEAVMISFGPLFSEIILTASLIRCLENASEILILFDAKIFTCQNTNAISQTIVYKSLDDTVAIPLTITATNYSSAVNNGAYIIESILRLPFGIELSDGNFIVNMSDENGLRTTVLPINDSNHSASYCNVWASSTMKMLNSSSLTVSLAFLGICIIILTIVVNQGNDYSLSPSMKATTDNRNVDLGLLIGFLVGLPLFAIVIIAMVFIIYVTVKKMRRMSRHQLGLTVVDAISLQNHGSTQENTLRELSERVSPRYCTVENVKKHIMPMKQQTAVKLNEVCTVSVKQSGTSEQDVCDPAKMRMDPTGYVFISGNSLSENAHLTDIDKMKTNEAYRSSCRTLKKDVQPIEGRVSTSMNKAHVAVADTLTMSTNEAYRAADVLKRDVTTPGSLPMSLNEAYLDDLKTDITTPEMSMNEAYPSTDDLKRHVTTPGSLAMRINEAYPTTNVFRKRDVTGRSKLEEQKEPVEYASVIVPDVKQQPPPVDVEVIKLNEAYRATSQSTSGTTNDSCVLDESVADTQAICSSVKMREFPADVDAMKMNEAYFVGHEAVSKISKTVKKSNDSVQSTKTSKGTLVNELKAYFVAEDLVPMNTNEAYSATMDDSKRVVVTAENKRVRDTAIVERSRSTTMQEPDTINAALDEPQDGTYSPVQIKTRRKETGDTLPVKINEAYHSGMSMDMKRDDSNSVKMNPNESYRQHKIN